jgi:hypothetical protein
MSVAEPNSASSPQQEPIIPQAAQRAIGGVGGLPVGRAQSFLERGLRVRYLVAGLMVVCLTVSACGDLATRWAGETGELEALTPPAAVSADFGTLTSAATKIDSSLGIK